MREQHVAQEVEHVYVEEAVDVVDIEEHGATVVFMEEEPVVEDYRTQVAEDPVASRRSSVDSASSTSSSSSSSSGSSYSSYTSGSKVSSRGGRRFDNEELEDRVEYSSHTEQTLNTGNLYKAKRVNLREETYEDLNSHV